MVFNLALKSRVFPTRWKVARLVLLRKPGKQVGDPALFWPLCMLDTVGKIFEQVLAERLRKHFRGKRALSANQYGFRTGCSTIDAARKLKKLAASAIKKRQFGAAVSLDIQNAFNPYQDVKLNPTKAVKYRGIILNEKLMWKAHEESQVMKGLKVL